MRISDWSSDVCSSDLLEPGPVVLLSTATKAGRPNVMTMSWHMMMEFTPPLIGCVVSSGNHSFAALRATRQCVIAVPARKLAAKVVKVGRSEEHTSELQSLMRISYAVFCLKKKKK